MIEKIDIEDISINRIRCFVSVYELGSISKAALDCDVSQPAMSRSIKSLEEQFNFPLFNRDTRQLHPTDAAKQIYPRCLELCTAARALCNELDVIKDGDYGELRIGLGKVIGPISSRAISKVISEKFADLRVSIVEGSPTLLHRELLQGNLDFFISHSEAVGLFSNVEQLVCKPFTLMKVDAVASPTAEFLNSGTDLISYPWTFPKFEAVETSQDHFYANYYKKIQANGGILYQIDNADARIKLVLSGQAATVIASSEAEKYLESGQLIKLPISLTDFPLSTYYLSTKPLCPKARQMIEYVKAGMHKN
ncbi:LysR family transcriptional regulator [Vibrio marisflavi]|uniref:HTH lysR-type domain-containing protein n=1 Tax=Vibrio marisflavi CECT 7928 TaxID=634439 RepID=A0ABN8DXM6_9VIBR|nr:LysR family transcriptional regulator [Vibrio marisflavi]CAH0536323.1 hypothetical protein VMF7928_00335 [Vibrio marisflavi CECT 7928]